MSVSDDGTVREGDDGRVLLTLPPRPEGGYPKNEKVAAYVTLDGQYDLDNDCVVDVHEAYISQNVVELSAGKANWLYNETMRDEYKVAGDSPILDRYDSEGRCNGHVVSAIADFVKVGDDGEVTCSGNFSPGVRLSSQGTFIEAQGEAAFAAECLAQERQRAFDQALVKASFQRDGQPSGDIGAYEDVDFVIMAHIDPKTGEVDTSKTSLWVDRTDPDHVNTHIPSTLGGDVYAGVEGNVPELPKEFLDHAKRVAGDQAQFYAEMHNGLGAEVDGAVWVIPVRADAGFDGYRFNLDEASLRKSGAEPVDCVRLMEAQGYARDIAENQIAEQAQEQAQREQEYAELVAEQRARKERNTDIIIPLGGGATYGEYKQRRSQAQSVDYSTRRYGQDVQDMQQALAYQAQQAQQPKRRVDISYEAG